MKKLILFFLLGVFQALFCLHSFSQVIQASSLGYKPNTLIFLSDSTTKSALLCNILPDRSGAQSPLIGTGTWTDNGKEVEVSSLLYFDLNQIRDIKPEDIKKAWLLMVPISSNLEVFNPDNTKIRIRRVSESWEDSIATWSNQPAISDEHMVNYTLKKPDTNNFYKFNVSKLVREMQRSGNFGFEISFTSKDHDPNFGRLYYSPRVEESEIRPMLVIELYNTYLNYNPIKTNGQDTRWQNFNTYNQAAPMYDRREMMEYMKPPVVRPEPHNDPPPPPKKSEN